MFSSLLSRLLPCLGVLTLMVADVAPVHAQASGTWEVTMEGPRGERTMTLVLEEDGETLTGTLTIARQGPRGGSGSREVEITDGSVEGHAFSFQTAIQMRGNRVVQTYRGTVDGDVMSGVVEGPRGEQPFTGRRAS